MQRPIAWASVAVMLWTWTATPRELPLTLRAPVTTAAAPKRWIGVSYASQALALGSEQDGLIVAMPVRDGDAVEAGEVLFALSSAEQALRAKRLRLMANSDAAVRRARAELEYAAGERARTATLARGSVASELDLAARDFELAMAEARLEEAQLDHRTRALDAEQAEAVLAQRTIRSPIDGVVAKILHGRGQTIEKIDPVIEVIDLDPLWIELDCPLEDSQLLRPGAELRVRRASVPDDARTATVIHASMQADPSSGSFRVRLSLDNGTDPWKAGLKIWIEHEDGVKTPAGAPK
ncbi:MAG: efflux RND transporter periplasmic adaptor subunit [Planctomycetota bacterium]